MKRIEYLDGLRILFCLIVIIHHYLQLFYPDAPIILINDGRLAVMFFLVLTGIVTTLKALHEKKYGPMWRCLLDFALKRYLRLMPVVFISILFAWFLSAYGAYCTGSLAAEYGLTKAGLYYNRSFSIAEALIDGILGAFFVRPELNTPLWIISYEMWGSVAVYLTVNVLQRTEKRKIVFAAMCTATALAIRDVYSAALLSGMAFAFIVHSMPFSVSVRFQRRIPHGMIRLGCLFCLVALMVVRIVRPTVGKDYLCIAFVVIGLAWLHYDQQASILWKRRHLLKISQYTYAAFALHWPVLCSFSCGFVLKVGSLCGYHGRVAVAFLISLLLIFVLSILCTKLTNALMNLLSNVKIPHV